MDESNKDNAEFAEVEALLRRYRPAGPAPDLRQRVVAAATAGNAAPASLEMPQRRSWATAGYVSAAATLAASFLLNFASAQVTRQTMALVQPGPHWTAEAEDAARLLDGPDGGGKNSPGRQYIAMALLADAARTDRYANPLAAPQ